MFTFLVLVAGVAIGSKFETEIKFASKYIKAKVTK